MKRKGNTGIGIVRKTKICCASLITIWHGIEWYLFEEMEQQATKLTKEEKAKLQYILGNQAFDV